MSIIEMGALGELVGGSAVLFTLVYLIIQVRQNTQLLKVSGFSQAIEQCWSAWLKIAEQPDLGRIMNIGWQNPDELTDDEFQRFTSVVGGLVWGLEHTFYFSEVGLVPNEVWDNLMENNAASGFYETAGFKSFMAARPGSISEQFKRAITERCGVDFEVDATNRFFASRG